MLRCAAADYYKQSPEKDPTGPATGKHRKINGLLLAPSRVLRGGSWGSNAVGIRSVSRGEGVAADRNYCGFGFRVVRELD